MNTAGTGASAIALTATAGGVSIDSAISSNLTMSANTNSTETLTISATNSNSLSVSSLTTTNTTATATTTTAHGLSTGDSVTIAGATPSAYNGNKTVTVTSATVFTFTIASGTSSPATGTITANNNSNLTMNADGIIRIGTTKDTPISIGNSTASEVTVNHNLTVVNSLTVDEIGVSSDNRLKKDISTLDNSIETVMQLRGVNFTWNKNDKKSIGFIAQEVQGIIPELVFENEKTGYLAVNYAQMVAVLTEAVKSQQQMITSLQDQINELKNA